MRMRLKEDGDTLLVRLTGEFERTGVGGVEAALERIAAHTTRLVFDLRGLSFLDAWGLMTILKANARANSEPFEVIVVRPRGLASRVFTLTRAGKQLTIVDDIPPRNATAGEGTRCSPSRPTESPSQPPPGAAQGPAVRRFARDV